MSLGTDFHGEQPELRMTSGDMRFWIVREEEQPLLYFSGRERGSVEVRLSEEQGSFIELSGRGDETLRLSPSK